MGWALKQKSGKKKVVLELGGNAGVIVHSDADVEQAARPLCSGWLFLRRTELHFGAAYFRAAIREPKFLATLVAGVKKLKVGNPLRGFD